MRSYIQSVIVAILLIGGDVSKADWLFTSQLGKQSLYDVSGSFNGVFSTLPPETNRSLIGPDGKIYVSNPSLNQVVVFDQTGSTQRVFASLSVPIGLAMDDSRRLYVSSNGNSIVRYFLDGRVDSSFQVTGVCGAHDVVFHKGTIYVSSQCGKIFAYSTEGALLQVLTPGLQNLVGLAIDENDILYFTSFDEFPLGTGAVGRINSDGSGGSVIVTGLFRPHGINIGPDGKLYVVQLYKNNVLRFNLDGSDGEVFISDISNPLGITYVTPSSSFATFTPRAEFTLGPKANDDSYWVRGWLKLADTSNGINPLTEAIMIKVGPFTHTLPAGSFTREGDSYVFKGPVGASVLDLRITGSSTPGGYSFKSCLKKADLEATTLKPDVQLTIGDDSGQATLDVGYAKFGKGSNGKNWVFPPAQ